MDGGRALVLVVYVVTFIFGLPANMCAICIFGRKIKQGAATPVDILLTGLTLSDLLFLVFLPLWMKMLVEEIKLDMSHFLCPLSGLIFYGTIYSSTLHLTAISVERYMGVAFPIKYKLYRKPSYAMVGSAIIWVVSLCQCSIVIVMQQHPDAKVTNETACYDNFTHGQLEILLPFRLQQFILLFCVPLLICFFCYVNFIRILSKLPNFCPKRRRRAIGLALGTMVLFIVCFGPYNISHLVGYLRWESPQWRKPAVLTSTLNTCLDPFIYYFSSSTLRGTFRRAFERLLKKQPVSPSLVHHNNARREASEDGTQSTNDNLANQ